MITVTTPCQDVKPNTFMIEGKYSDSVVHFQERRDDKCTCALC